MKQSAQHPSDEVLSALIDERLAPDELTRARGHIDGCSRCQMRRDELQSVVELLRALPSVEPPCSFELGPRLVVDPPNVIRLRRWYTIARASAASLAAAFVFLSVGALYVDSQPVDERQSLAVKAQSESARAPVQYLAAPTPASAAPVAPRAAAPAPAGARSQLAGAPAESSDQVAAATSVGPLPTPVAPTGPPAAAPASRMAEPVASAQGDAAAPLRTVAAVVGVLAVLGVMAALVARHRLVKASNLPAE